MAGDIGVEKPSKDEVEDVLKYLDNDGDGRLDILEFEVFIKQVLQKTVVKLEMLAEAKAKKEKEKKEKKNEANTEQSKKKELPKTLGTLET